MESILTSINTVISRICVPLAICLCVIAILRIIARGRGSTSIVARINKCLRKMHIPLAITLVCVTALHVILSYAGFTALSGYVFGFIWGIVCLAFLVLLCINYIFRKKFKPNWMFWHRILASGFFISLVLHMREVESIMGGH